MQRVLVSAFLLLCAGWVDAQTIKITTSNGPCTYPTGAVKSDPAVPGQLLATATGAGTGAGCAPATTSSAVSFGPASPLAPSTQSLGNGGGSASLSFQVVNATQCTGTITGASGGTFASSGASTATLCNSANSCRGTQNVVTSFPANSTGVAIDNTVVVSCSDGSTTVPSQAVVTVSGGSSGPCPTIASSTSGITNFQRWTGNNAILINGNPATADVTSFASVYGAWPGAVFQELATISLPTSKYASLQFTVPSGYMAGAPADRNGYYSLNPTSYTAPVSMTISTTCGDFSNPSNFPGTSTVVPGCYRNKGTSGQSFLVVWAKQTSCVLQDGQAYYLNFINADISAVQPGGGTAASTQNSKCFSGTCQDPIVNGPGNW